MTVDSPRCENAFSESIFTRTTDVIHDLVPAILNDCFADASRNVVERFVPGRLFPLAFAAFAGAFERIKDAIRIVNLVKRGRTLSAVTPARAGMLRIPFKLLNLTGDFIDVGQQPTRRLAVEASGGNKRVMSLLTPRPDRKSVV